MPRGDKSSYSPKQRRQAEHIEESSESRGYGKKRAEQIAWATVNKQSGGAKGKGTKKSSSPKTKSTSSKSSKSSKSSSAGKAKSKAKSRGGKSSSRKVA